MDALKELLYQKAQKQADDIREYRIKLIATQNDYEDLQNYWKMYEEGTIDLATYNSIAKEIMDMIAKRWGIGME